MNIKLNARHLLACTMALAFILAGSVASAGPIIGSKHDFATGTGQGKALGTETETCKVCHTPHTSSTYTSGNTLPLWNRTLSSQSFTTYSSGLTLSQGTLVCLSCHDGATALGDFGGATTSATTAMTGTANIGLDLGTSHPVGKVCVGTGEYKGTGTSLSDSGQTIADVLSSSKVACSTCHNVHGKTGVSKFLRGSNTNSALCASCHDK